MDSTAKLLFIGFGSRPLSLSFLILLLLCVGTLLSPTLAVRCNPSDKKVLLEIKNYYNDPYLLASWNPDTDCCYWYLVRCDRKTNRIVSLIFLSDDKISGEIPPIVSRLPYLRTLEYHKLPKIVGPIPPAIANLTSLNSLRLSWTNISGPVPKFLSTLKNLTFLDLSFNNLSGTVPPELSKLPNLGALHLDRNHLTGSIPDSFGDFALAPSVPDLYLSHNNLSGSIPKSLGRLNLTVIDLSRNKLDGDASMLLGANKTVQIVDLSRNVLQFELTDVTFPSSLTSLDVSHNKIKGSLPAELTQLQLQFLNVSYNRLCGPIPTGGKLQSFDSSSYFHNRCLCGAPLPSCK